MIADGLDGFILSWSKKPIDVKDHPGFISHKCTVNGIDYYTLVHDKESHLRKTILDNNLKKVIER